MKELFKLSSGVIKLVEDGSPQYITGQITIQPTGTDKINILSNGVNFGQLDITDLEIDGVTAPVDREETMDLIANTILATEGAASGIDSYRSSTFIAVSTDGVYTAFANTPCAALQIDNGSDVDILVQKGGAGGEILIASKTGRLFVAISNANQLAVKRATGSGAVSVSAEALVK